MQSIRIVISILLLLTLRPATAEVSPPSPTLTPVTIQLHWQHQFQFAGIYTAIEKGYYRDAGLDVTIQTGYAMPYDEVESGQVEFGLSGTGIVAEYLNGREITALGATFQESPYAWLVKSDSGIYSANDFIGRTFALQSQTDDLMAIFAKEKIDISRMKFIPSSKHDIDYLVTGKVDAITAYVSNEPFFMKERGIPYRLISPHDYGMHFYSDILFTSKAFAEQNPDIVKAFMDATYQGWRYTADHQNEIIQLVLDKYNTQNKSPEHVHFEANALLKLSLYPTVDFGHMTFDRWQKIAEVYQSLNYVSEIQDLDHFIFAVPKPNGSLFKWLSISFGGFSLLVLIGYQLKKHHNEVLQKQIEQQTASIKAELAKHEQLELAAKKEQVKLQTLLDNTADSVITINEKGIIEQYNKASISLFGYAPEEVIGRNISMLMPTEYHDQHQLGLSRFLSTHQSKIMGIPVELEALHKSGSRHAIELTVTAFNWEENYIFIGIARDITKQKAEQKELLETKWEAERANNAKSEFLSAMSHELRTPLNSILGFSQLLLTEKSADLSTKQSNYIKQIISSGEHLLSLVNDVLDLSKIEAGSINTVLEPIRISSLIEESLPMLMTLASKHGVTIEQQNDTDAIVLADYVKLKQAFINLVINAIKYNRNNGNVFIATEQQDGHLKLTIQDTGPGIPTDKQDRVFTAFERLGQEHADIEGSGVGLSVSKRFIEAMNGTIDFESIEGQGSTFWMSLPTSELEPSNKRTEKQASNILLARRGDAANTIKKVLYVEDNPANVRLMEVFFSRIDKTELQACDSAEVALKLMRQNPPDIVLMDINLTGMSGLDAAKIMREDPLLQNIPVLALTAAAMQQNIDDAHGLFDSYITKPIDFNELSKVLHNYF